MAHRVTLIPGDGTGPELAEATKRVLEATGVEFDWDRQDAGVDVFEEEGDPLPERTLESIRERKIALKGPTTTPVGSGHRSINVALRKEFDLYACIRPCKAYEGVRTRFPETNIMKHTDGLFLEVARKVAEKHDDIEFEDRIIDNLCNQLVSRPEEYDVIVLPNLYGDIVSDLGAGMSGGLGLAPGGNIGDDYAVFEATHGSAPKYTGMNKVNPTALMLSGVMMLRHLGEREAADRMESAIAEVIREGQFVTYDMKPSRDDPTAVGTSEMADAVIEKIKAGVTA